MKLDKAVVNAVFDGATAGLLTLAVCSVFGVILGHMAWLLINGSLPIQICIAIALFGCANVGYDYYKKSLKKAREEEAKKETAE